MRDRLWRRILDLSDLEENQPHVVTLDEIEVVLLRREGKVIAFANNCPHHGAPMGDGFISGDEVVCPWHNARFNMNDGGVVSPPALDGLSVYEVRVEAGAVFIGAKVERTVRKSTGSDARTILIIGGGAVAEAASEMLRQRGFAGKIQMITQENAYPYDRTLLSKPYLSGKNTDDDLPLRSPSFYKDLEIEVMTGCRIQSVDPEKHQACAEDGQIFDYSQLLLATGGRPKKSGVPGENLRNVLRLRNWEDARLIRKALDAGSRRALVVGAGFIGLEVAASLRERDVTVRLAAPEEKLLTSIFGEAVGEYLQKRHEAHGVAMHLGKRVKLYRGDEKGDVREAALSDGTSMSADLVIEGVGIEPVVDYLEGSGLLENGAVPVNGRMQTRHPDIFAAGDIARIPDPITGIPHRFEHWVEAQRQGRHAALSMLGGEAQYSEVPFFWTRQYGESLKYVGNAPEFDRTAVLGSISKGRFVIGYYQNGKLLAAASIGMDAELFAVEKHLKRGDTLTPERLESGSLR